MFAEELAGNASRKRAEENRARRRRLKQAQEKKAGPPPAAATPQSSAVAASSMSPITSVNIASHAHAVSVTTLTLPKESVSSKELTAVEKANAQRELRARVARQSQAAITIQKIIRSRQADKRLRKEQTELLQTRLLDIQTLRGILKQKSNANPYVPPPATVTVLVRQILLLTKWSHGGNKMPRIITKITAPEQLVLLQQVLEFAVLPGAIDEHTHNDDMNPLTAWLETPEGRLRLEGLLRLTLVALTDERIREESWGVLFHFLNGLLTNTNVNHSVVRKHVSTYCRALLLPLVTSAILPGETAKEPPYAIMGSSLDLVSFLRYFLLFVVAGRAPIPTNAETAREACVSNTMKYRAGLLFKMLLDNILFCSTDAERRHMSATFTCCILTVPLLTWKLCPKTLDYLVQINAQLGGGYPPLLCLIRSFAEVNCDALAGREIESVFPKVDVPVTRCAATPSQCMLANMVQLARLCPTINGLDPNKLDFNAAALYFNIVSLLLDAVPLGTFTSRDSAVEWIVDRKGSHKPIVLSTVVMDHCRALLVDSFVRQLFVSAINKEALKVNAVLSTKYEKDIKDERDLLEAGTSSAAGLAAKEARIDRNKSFWASSKWAQRLSKSVARFVSGGAEVAKEVQIEAKNADKTTSPNMSQSTEMTDTSSYSPAFLFALCHAYGVILARWGGGGKEDMVRNMSTFEGKRKREIATRQPEPCTVSLLNSLCFGTSITEACWSLLQSHNLTMNEVQVIIDPDMNGPPVRSLTILPGCSTPSDKGNSAKKLPGESSKDFQMKNQGVALLYTFTCTLAHTMIVTDDFELHDSGKPVPVHHIRRCIRLLKKLLYRACYLDTALEPNVTNYFGLALISASAKTLRDLYDRSSRRPLCVPKMWIVSDLLDKELRSCKSHADYVALLSSPVLRICPFLVSFKRRLKLFERIVTNNRNDIQGVNDGNPFNTNPLKPGIPVRITRGRILEDGLATMNNLGANMRQRISVQFYNETGVRETGVDAGGLFKEFWTDLCAIAFNPDYALFRVTDGPEKCLYPNPLSGSAHGSDHTTLFAFLGRILGKALYEGITIHPRFAHFFLSFLRGDYNYLHMLPDLTSVDQQLYNNLMFLKYYDGDATDLCLTFTVTIDDFGGNKEVPLIPNGETVEVTNSNKQRYIGLVAKHYVVDRVKEQSEAFTKGLWEVIDRSWLRLFNEPELQVLISGASDGKIDVEDMRAHSSYAGGYTGIDRNIVRFWKVVASFNTKEQGELLRFVTGCERPPPLGFSSLNPPFTIQRVGILRDGDLLPTASTCFNTLKLPTYSSEKVLRQRLLYAIQSGAGFELT